MSNIKNKHPPQKKPCFTGKHSTSYSGGCVCEEKPIIKILYHHYEGHKKQYTLLCCTLCVELSVSNN